MFKKENRIEILLEQILKEIKSKNSQPNKLDIPHYIQRIKSGSRVQLLENKIDNKIYPCRFGSNSIGDYRGFVIQLFDEEIGINIHDCSFKLEPGQYVVIKDILYFEIHKKFRRMYLGVTIDYLFAEKDD